MPGRRWTLSRAGRRSLSLAGATLLVVLFVGCAEPDAEEVVAGPETTTVLLDLPDTTTEQMNAAAEVVRSRLMALDLQVGEVGWDDAAIEVIVPAEDEQLVRQALEPVDGLVFRPVLAMPADASTPTTPPDQRAPDAQVTLTGEDGSVYRLGPVAVGGPAVESATAELSEAGQWVVNPVLRPGADGIDAFNAIAAECYTATPEVCPALSATDVSGAGRGLLALVADDVVLSAPSIFTPAFDRDQIEVSGDFSEDEARALAAALDGGPANVPWTVRD